VKIVGSDDDDEDDAIVAATGTTDQGTIKTRWVTVLSIVDDR